MSSTTTPHAADFTAALAGYNSALAAYQLAVNAIEDAGRVAQSEGRRWLSDVNDVTLNAGTVATCVVRATIDAQLLKLDLDVHARTANGTVVEDTIASLHARLRQLESARAHMEHARKLLDVEFDAIAKTGHAALEALSGCLDAAAK
jgi:hypothetical protein